MKVRKICRAKQVNRQHFTFHISSQACRSSVRRYSHFSFTISVAGSREQSYVYALAAAALTQSIAKACSSGASAKCSCGPLPNEPPPGEFKWGGCGDDVGFGIIFSKWFTDTPWNKRRKSKRHLVNIHNNAVGRQVCFSYIKIGRCTQTSCRIKHLIPIYLSILIQFYS